MEDVPATMLLGGEVLWLACVTCHESCLTRLKLGDIRNGRIENASVCARWTEKEFHQGLRSAGREYIDD